MRRFAGLLMLGALPVLSGCAAAVIPVVAGGMIAKKKAEQDKAKEQASSVVAAPVPAPASAPEPAPVPVQVMVGPAVDVATPGAASPAPAIVPGLVTPLTGPYALFASYALGQAEKQQQGTLTASTVLVEQFALERPEFLPCDTKPAAVILDLDDGQSGGPPGSRPTPGLDNALAKLRASHIVIFWLTDAGPDTAEALRQRLTESGLDPNRQDAILTRYDATDRKHVRRQDIARTHCVLASVGDSKADVEEAYAYLRQPEAAFIIDKMWNAGWFLLPAPLTHETDAKDQ